MNRTLKFNKESSGNWYANIPEWTGSKDDLQMVLGADTLLDIIAQDENDVVVYFSTEPFEGSNVMSLFTYGIIGNLGFGGGTYRMHQYMGIEYKLDLWLCDVTNFVFGYMPDMIFFKKTI